MRNEDYDSYGDWYDNGPGSESFKRACSEPFEKKLKVYRDTLDEVFKKREIRNKEIKKIANSILRLQGGKWKLIDRDEKNNLPEELFDI